MRSRRTLYILAVPLVLALAAVFAYQLPPIHDRLSWRLESLQIKIQTWLHPPKEAVFVPQVKSTEQLQAAVRATLTSLAVTAAPVQLAAETQNPGTAAATASTPAAQPSATLQQPTALPPPTETPVPLPASVELPGITYQGQAKNNCGPANLAMALSFWGWKGDQYDTRAGLRPYFDGWGDRNVMPWEMVDFAEKSANLQGLVRMGGNPELLKRFLAAGLPMLIEMGDQPPQDKWMGHYLTISGYNDQNQEFIVQDSLLYKPDIHLPLSKMYPAWWRDFNYVYIVLYPPNRAGEVQKMLGPQADQATNFKTALQVAEDETTRLQGRDLLFAWFNVGTNFVGLKDYPHAAEAYDKAFTINLTLSDEQRLDRLMWYQTGPYEAYYQVGRYQDVINLANVTIQWAGQNVLEETLYWRGMAELALDQKSKAIFDFRKAYSLNPNSTPSLAELQRLGVTP